MREHPQGEQIPSERESPDCIDAGHDLRQISVTTKIAPLPDDPTPIPMRQDADKFTLQLESMERHFRDRLLEILPNAARTGSPVFTNTTFNPHNLRPHVFRTDADELLDDAQACL